MRGLIVVGVMVFVLNAQAQTSAADWGKEAEQRAVRVGELAQDDMTGEAAPQLEIVRGLLNRVQGHLANDDLDPLPRLFARIDRIIDWVSAMEERMVTEKNAEALQGEAAIAMDEAAKAEESLAEVKARFDELEAKGL